MVKTVIPFSPLPLNTLKVISGIFSGPGSRIAKTLSYLELELKQAGMLDVEASEYGAIMVFMMVFYFFFGTAIAALLAYRFVPDQMVLLAPTIGIVFGLLVLMQIAMYPKMRIKKKVRDIERNLIFALRTMLVEIKSGVSLFEGIRIVANSSYGGVSTEFKHAVNEINTGTAEDVALQELALRNPSRFFRRAIWQLVNGMKAGTDVGTLFSSLIDTLSKEQTIQIRRYGSSLRMLSLLYMMLGVIIPALGLTFMIILGSFPQMSITEIMFWVFLLVLLVAQIMYVGALKTKRPTLVGV